MAIYKANNQIGKLYKGNVQIGKVYKGSTLVYSAESDSYTLSITNGAVTHFNGGNGEGPNLGSWNSETMTVPDYSRMTVTSYSVGGVYGYSQTELLVGSQQLAYVSRGDYNGVGSWGNKTYSVTPGQTLTFRICGSVDINRSGQSDISGYVTFYFHD